MEPKSLSDLNKYRKLNYYKDENEEEYLKQINLTLRNKEVAEYKNIPIKHPFLFVFGLPRSGTTMLTQLIIRTFTTGYINNFMARFWLAPVTGIKLSKIILGNKRQASLSSNYGSTKNIYDLHEFGYFWRHWLEIDSIQKLIQIEKRENEINWNGLNLVLANMQHEFDKAFCMKNIFGAYHLPQMVQTIPHSIWLYIRRDPLDNAISVLNARKKFYQDMNHWWSTIPLEFDRLKEEKYIDQIAGQIYYLTQFYEKQIKAVDPKHVFQVDYKNLCKNPDFYIRALQNKMAKDFDYKQEIGDLPKSLNYKTYDVDNKEKEQLKTALSKYNMI